MTTSTALILVVVALSPTAGENIPQPQAFNSLVTKAHVVALQMRYSDLESQRQLHTKMTTMLREMVLAAETYEQKAKAASTVEEIMPELIHIYCRGMFPWVDGQPDAKALRAEINKIYAK